MTKDRPLPDGGAVSRKAFNSNVFRSEVPLVKRTEENELHKKQGFRDLSSWLAPIRLRTIAGVSRYQPGRKTTAIPPSKEDSSPTLPS